MVLGMLLGFLVTSANPELGEVFVSAEHLVESPSQRVARLEAAERDGESEIANASMYSIFSTFLFTHNIRV